METAKGLIWWHFWGAPPWEDLAREEIQLEAAAAGHCTLATYGWDSPTLVLGYGQAASSVDLSACAKHRVAVLRRLSGGMGVLHQGDLSMSLALPSNHPWAGSISGLYDRLVGAVQEALASFGVAAARSEPRADASPPGRSPICFEDHRAESLLVAGRKVLGCAQVRRRGAVLVHGTALFRLDAALQSAVYDVPEARVRAAMAPLPPAGGLGPDTLAEATARALASALGFPPPVPVPPPALPVPLEARARDPKWVLLPR